MRTITGVAGTVAGSNPMRPFRSVDILDTEPGLENLQQGKGGVSCWDRREDA
jgi:hypothetical protein